jgi:hypothetical protein
LLFQTVAFSDGIVSLLKGFLTNLLQAIYLFLQFAVEKWWITHESYWTQLLLCCLGLYLWQFQLIYDSRMCTHEVCASLSHRLVLFFHSIIFLEKLRVNHGTLPAQAPWTQVTICN